MEELKKQAHKEFDEKFKENYYKLVSTDLDVKGDDVKSFIDYIIDKTVQMTEERIVREIQNIDLFEVETDFNDGGDDEYANRRIAVDSARRTGEHQMKSKIISLITNKSDINKDKE